jgi:hypothetical protein
MAFEPSVLTLSLQNLSSSRERSPLKVCPFFHLQVTTRKCVKGFSSHRILKMVLFWVVAPCGLIALKMEAVQTSETSVNSYQSTRRCNPADGHLHSHRSGNFKSYQDIDAFY